MIDKFNEIFTHISTEIKKEYPDIQVTVEYGGAELKFPCVTIEETSNIPTLLDSASVNRYATVRYRVSVFSNSINGKRAEARRIYNSVDLILQKLGMIPTSYVTTPTLYQSTVYQITVMYQFVLDENGCIYRR